jgi:hypothetical protein
MKTFSNAMLLRKHRVSSARVCTLAVCFLFAVTNLIRAADPAEPAQKKITTPLPNFDRRLEQPKPAVPVADASMNAAKRLQSRAQQLRIDRDSLFGAPKFVASTAEFLTGPNGAGGTVSDATANLFPANEPHRGVKTFLTEHKALFGFGPEALAAATVKRDYVSASGGFSTTVWHQHVDDIAVFEAVFKAHLTKNGELINVSSQFVPDLPMAVSQIAARTTLEATPPISARQAIILAAQNIGDVLSGNQLAAQDSPQGNEQVQHFRGSPVLNNTSARLTWLPVAVSTLRLCWNVNVESRARGELYQILVDAQTGEIWLRQCLTEYISNISLNVWTNESPTPMMPTLSSMTSYQPPQVPRTLVTFAALDTNASPAGWVNDGDNTTVGNNVDAHLDWNNDNIADPGSHPAGSPNRVFSYVVDLTQEPSNNWAPAVVSLFYWNNFAHDRFYEYGFTEAAGNFQSSNFGRGGSGNDPVQADGQDSYMLAATNGTSRDNANFATPTDGSSPRMQMYIFNFPSPNRDDDLDATMMLHEYTHGVSSRLVGGGVGITGLQTSEMGEGWSDFCALSLLSNPTNDPDANQGMFAYVGYNFFGMTSNYYFGLRRYPYSVNTNINPLTFKDIDTNQISPHTGVPISPWLGYNPANANEVHNAGEVWCIALWEARSRMCHKYGNAAGNQMMLQLVIDGMKFSPANPIYLQARDAILQADRVDYGGADQDLLWASFAKRGMGYSASSLLDPNTTSGIVEAFNTPPDTNAPVLAVVSPANNSFLNSFTNISGTAYDGGSGLQNNQIHFSLNNSGNFWSGTYWTNTSANDPSIVLSANVVNGVWNYASVPTGGDQVQGTYYVSAFARDNAGNVSQAQSGVTSTSFTVVSSPPTVAITFPLNGSTLTNQPGGNWFQGTATGSFGVPLGISLFIRRDSDGLYWTGSGWGDETNGFISNTYTSGTESWQSTGTLPVPGSSLANGTYNFIAIAKDTAGNQQQVDSVVTVNFHPVFVFNYGSQSGINPNMNWNDPANWDVGSVPTPDARVVINAWSPDTGLGSVQIYGLDMSGGQLTTAGMLIQKLNLSGGILVGGAITLTADGIFNWSGGSIGGVITLPVGANLFLSSTNDKIFSVNSSVALNGNTVWTDSGNLVAGYGAGVTNTGTFSIQGDAQFIHNDGYPPVPVFNNIGVLQKTNAVGTTIVSAANAGWSFINSGLFDIESGVLSAQANLYLNSGGTLAGAGVTSVDAGYAQLNGTTTLQPGATFQFTGGVLDGQSSFAGSGNFVWSGGEILGTVAIQTNANFFVKTLAPKMLIGSVTNFGTALWTDGGQINANYASQMENDGTFMAQSGAVYLHSDGYPPVPLFINNGKFIVTNNPGNVDFDPANAGVAFNNNGTVIVQSGSLSLGGGGSSQNATFNVASSSRLDLNGNTHFFGPGINFGGSGLLRLTDGTLTLAGTNTYTTNGTVEIAGGTVTGAGAFAGSGVLNWSGGHIFAAVNLQSNVQFNILGDSNKTLDVNGSLYLAGNSAWTGAGQVLAGYGSIITNAGNFTAQSDAQFFHNDGYPPVPIFVNNGTFTKTNSIGVTSFNPANAGMALNNNGTINVASGSLLLGGGGDAMNGRFKAAAGSWIDYNSGAFSFSGNTAFSNPGTNLVSNATLTFINTTSTMVGDTFQLAGGQIFGTNTFAGAGTFNWSGGTISAVLNLQTSVSLNINSTNIKTLSIGTVSTFGNTVWTNSGNINASYASAFINNGTFIAQDSADFVHNDGYPPVPIFINNGIFTKTGAGSTNIFRPDNGGVLFDNNNEVNAGTGVLILGAGGAGTNGNFYTGPSTRIDFSGGTFDNFGPLTFAGQGLARINGATFNQNGSATTVGATLELAAGALNTTSTVSGPGAINWTGGTIGGSPKLQSNLALNISGGTDKTLAAGTILGMAGATTWTGAGNLQLSYGSAITNSGTFTAQNDAEFIHPDGYSPSPIFNNNGTFRKTSATGTTTFALDNGGVSFNNSGTLDLRSGFVAFDGGEISADNSALAISLAGPVAGTQFGAESSGTPAGFAGTLSVSLASGFVPTNGESFAIATYPSRTGQFAIKQLPPLSYNSMWSLDYGATTLTLRVVPQAVLSNPRLTYNGHFLVTLAGPSASSAVLWASTNLFDWDAISTNAPFTGSFIFDDPWASSYSQRFYLSIINP